MEKSTNTVKDQLLEERNARLRAEALLLEKEQLIIQLSQQNESLHTQLSSVDALKQELHYVQEIVNNAQDIVFISDYQGIFRYINPAAAQLLGFAMDEMLGKHFSALIREDYAEVIRTQYRDQVKNRLASSYLEFPVKNAEEREMWLGQQVSFVYQGDKLFEAHSIARDITSLRTAGERLRKSEEKYRSIMENMELGLLEVDSEAKIIRAYPRFCEMVGYLEEDLVGKDPKALFAPQGFLDRAQQEEVKFLKGKSVIWEAPLRKKNGSIIWTLINNTPIYNDQGALVGTLGIHLDITEQKILQVDLERARQEAEQARDAEKAFLANISHEIRNPINSIVGMTNLLYDTYLSEEQQEYVNTLKYSADLLHALVSDVLDISKIEQGKMEPQLEDFDFFEMAKAMCKTFEFRLSQRPIQFQCEVSPSVPQRFRSDSTFINQILINLMNNAFKFTEEGKICCSAKAKLIDQQQWIEFIVKDTGIGISPERLPFIFERFNQAGKANKVQRDGTGLGLPITKQLVELLGGNIHVQSIPGVGTTFTVLLPFEPAAEPSLHPSETSEYQIDGAKGRLHVLIVEDNPMNRRYLENLMQKWGLSYTAADDGQTALHFLKKERFDLILMDIRMPILDGYETTLRLRHATKNRNQHVPIIALTASALLDEKEKALQAGMNHHLSKPFTPEQLQDALKQFFPGFSQPNNHSSTLGKALNRHELTELYDNDSHYMQEIFQIFVQTIPLELAQMRTFLEAEQWKDFAAKAHKIKPSFQMVGPGELSAHATLLERAKADFNPTDLARDFAAFEKAVVHGLKLVQDELKALA